MQVITLEEFNNYCVDVLKQNLLNIAKVCEHGDSIVKFFFPKKKWISSEIVKPKAFQFCENATKLRAQGVDAPVIEKITYCPGNKTYVLHYQKIEGESTRAFAQQQDFSLFPQVAALIATLHEKGIFFRSIHLGNIIFKPDHSFALIDIADVRFSKKSLSLSKRIRNIAHFLKREADIDTWKVFDKENFLSLYLKAAGLENSAAGKKLAATVLEKKIHQTYVREKANKSAS